MNPSRRDLARLLLAATPWLAAGQLGIASPAWAQRRRTVETSPQKPEGKDRGGPAGTTHIVEFLASPFPYDGRVPGRDTPFFDTTKDKRRGRTSPRGGFTPDSAYTDKRVLLHLGAGFNAARPAALVVFLHGQHSQLTRDLRNRQHIPAQFDASGLNGALVAPQLAFDAVDGAAGRFWEPGFFNDFLNEAASRLGELSKAGGAAFRAMPIIIVASGSGAEAAAYALQIGGAAARIHGVILLDAWLDERQRLVNWLATKRNDAFLVSAYGAAARADNAALKKELAARGFTGRDGRPSVLLPGSIWFLDAGNTDPKDFMTKAWTADPLKVLLAQIPEFRQQKR
ncbi:MULTISPECIES: alpha/beta hydrolase [unclassified Beijerinckia]|uniref:alpha/beta hydrolase n=1 Tax=unclassified Beijerinckia TaxID=2638183 RepID=UPI0008970E1E|nr:MULTISPECIES: alpha/beta hydrolase [unclassified Beijerinckia]MDH7796263.1 hypothetical protein [Beijerinckia sp. GAS462]SEC37534.1 hypothetical protein SAMN05443249_2546 [Beijerinckia sp. 28-YEA-48]